MYSLKDIALIIATYNRPEDLRETFRLCKHEFAKVSEILVVDQSKDEKTKNLVKNTKLKNLKYFHLEKPSLTGARNFGAEKSNVKIIVFIDDDATLLDGYFQGILDTFNKFDAIGVSGFQKNKGRGIFDRTYRKIFFLENSLKNNANVYSAYGPVYPSKLDKTIKSMWLCGHDMSYKKEVFQKYKMRFDENLGGYALGEDFDFSYRLWKLNKGGLYITPDARMIHRFSSTARTPSKKLIYMNQINHFYFNYKSFNKSIYEKFVFKWALTGLSIARIIQLIINPTSARFSVTMHFFKSLVFCLYRKKQIKAGKIKDMYEELKI